VVPPTNFAFFEQRAPASEFAVPHLVPLKSKNVFETDIIEIIENSLPPLSELGPQCGPAPLKAPILEVNHPAGKKPLSHKELVVEPNPHAFFFLFPRSRRKCVYSGIRPDVGAGPPEGFFIL